LEDIEATKKKKKDEEKWHRDEFNKNK